MKRLMVNGNRFYQIPGRDELYPSVTTVLGVISKKFLSRWETGLALDKFRARLRERLVGGGLMDITEKDMDAWVAEAHAEPGAALTDAGTFGTDAHDMFETLAKGRSLEQVPATHRVIVSNFNHWVATQPGIEFTETEITLWSDEHVYAGTADAMVRFPDGRLVLMDWKTGNRIYSESAMQVAAYAKAYEEMRGERVDEAWVVRFDKAQRKLPQIKRVSNMDATFDTFIHACRLWRSVQADMFKVPNSNNNNNSSSKD